MRAWERLHPDAEISEVRPWLLGGENSHHQYAEITKQLRELNKICGISSCIIAIVNSHEREEAGRYQYRLIYGGPLL